MGTNADFYVGRGPDAVWVGSVAWSGQPTGVAGRPGGLRLLRATTEDAFRRALREFLGGRGDAAAPPSHWPWPWTTSASSSFAYAFDDGKVWAVRPWRTYPPHPKFWFDPLVKEPADGADERICFPDMTAQMAVFVDEEPESPLMVGAAR